MAKDSRKISEKKIFNSLVDPILIIDKNYNIIDANKIFLKLISKTQTDVIGKKCYEVVHGADKPPRDCNSYKAFKTKKRADFEIYHPGLNKHLWISASPVLEGGSYDKIVHHIRDISEQKKAEQELRFHSEIMKNMEDGVILTRVSDAMIVYTNPKFEKLFGYGPGELIGRNITVVNAPTDKSPEKVAEEIQKCLREKGVWQGDICNIKKDGTSFWCRANVSIFEHHKYGKVWAATHTDITEQKKTELQKLKLQKKLEQYAKQLEIKVRNLEKDRISLTEKEKLVFWGLTRYPNDTDRQLSKKLKLKRSTVTSIKNRLKKKEMYHALNIPDFKALGAELITFAYGRFNVSFEEREEFRENARNKPDFNYCIHTDKEFIGCFISKSTAEFEKTDFSIIHANKKNIIKDIKTVHFLTELNKAYKFLEYSELLKNLFKIKIREEPEEMKKRACSIKLRRNEKKVLLKMTEYPGLSAYDLSFKVDLTRATAAKIKNKLIREKRVKTIIVPDIRKLGIELIALIHAKNSGGRDRHLKEMAEQIPNLVSFIGGPREAVGIGFFRDYDDYKKFKLSMACNKGVFSEEPLIFRILTKDIKEINFNFADITKRLLGE
jgi:PAS domain S-box-containing protein